MSDIVFSAKKRKQELKKLGAYHTKRALALMVKERLEALAGDSKIQKVMDICCGSGNLLSVFDDDVDKVGVDIEPEFVNYCKENLKGSFLRADALLLRGYSSPYIVGNYPFGLRDKEVAKKAWEYIKDYEIFKDMPELPSLLDSAFIAKNLQCLSSGGKAVLIFGVGWLYRGAKEEKFREWLVGKGWIKSLEIVEGDFFDDTTIRVGIMCLDMCKENRDIEMIEGERKAVATYEQIKENDFDLNLSRYLPYEKTQEEKELENFDIEASLEASNNLEIQGLELTLKMNKALELIQDATNQKAIFNPNNTPNHRLLRALEIKLKEWKSYISPKNQKKTIHRVYLIKRI